MPLDIRENVPLAPFTTLKIGGPARFFVEATAEEDVLEAFDYGDTKGLEVFVLGGGSNILVADEGFDGLVLQIALKAVLSEPPIVVGGLTRRNSSSEESIDLLQPPAAAGGSDSSVYLTAQAGEDWDSFVASCVDHDLAGVECLSGIPGFVGGTPVQNVGAYGQEVSETIVSVRCFDRTAREFVELSNAECGFEYRKSIFNSTHRDRYVVISVMYELQPNGEPKQVYKDLLEHFGDATPSLLDVREAVLDIRRSKSMVIDPDDPNSQSAGSFFKNPIVPIEKYDTIAESFGYVPHFPAGDGLVKIPAGWLIERAGFPKGFRKGRAGISSNHTLALINCGGASANEIIALKNDMQTAVKERFEIELQPEPIFVGFKN